MNQLKLMLFVTNVGDSPLEYILMHHAKRGVEVMP